MELKFSKPLTKQGLKTNLTEIWDKKVIFTCIALVLADSD
jgi:hypothetical protein